MILPFPKEKCEQPPHPGWPSHWRISLGRTTHIRMCGRDLRGIDLDSDSSWTESHFSIHWVFLFFSDQVELAIDDIRFSVSPGTGVFVPPHSHLTLRFLCRTVHHWFHFSCQAGRGNEVPIPALINLEFEAEKIREKLDDIVARFENDKENVSAQFTQFLEEMVLRTSASQTAARPMHPGLQCALEFIERNLHRNIHVSDVIEEVELSQRQLLKLMNELTGESVVGFIRRRRGERALYLLTKTYRPIQSIAIEVGIPDLHLFNKTVRQLFGRSPRELRKLAVTPQVDGSPVPQDYSADQPTT